MIALNEEKDEAVDSIDNQLHESHTPRVQNALESEDLMVVATPGQVTSSFSSDGDEEDLMERKTTVPSFNDIYGFISSNPVISDEKENILTATATSNIADELRGDDQPETRGKRNAMNAGNAGAEMKSIFTDLKSSKHHKLTRNDIRQLAKKAVMLATLKKLNEDKKSSTSTFSVKSGDKHSTVLSKPAKKHMKKKHTRKSRRKHRTVIKKTDITKTSNVDSSSPADASVPFTKSTKGSEMAEDLSHERKKSAMTLSDDAMSKTDKPRSDADADSDDLMPSTESSVTSSSNIESGSSIEKKSNIAQIDKSVENIFDDDDATRITRPTETLKKSSLPDMELKNNASPPDSQLSDKVTSIKTFLEKADPAKIPSKFLPDLPAGLRMIGWKELIEKKKKQLGELENAVGTTTETSEVKPVTVNIDVDQDNMEKEAATQTPTDDLFSVSGDKKHDTVPLTLQHVGYLQRHIKGARALRKLIAKTLVGHCKSTGQRILDAFVAMDKALARAQTIAAVIGKKFNVDADRIDALVGDKEDQVVETFLKDIFTKI